MVITRARIINYMDGADEGWIIISESNARALQVNAMFGFIVRLDGRLSFVNYCTAYLAYISSRTRITLDVSPQHLQLGHLGGQVPACRKNGSPRGKSLGSEVDAVCRVPSSSSFVEASGVSVVPTTRMLHRQGQYYSIIVSNYVHMDISNIQFQ